MRNFLRNMEFMAFDRKIMSGKFKDFCADMKKELLFIAVPTKNLSFSDEVILPPRCLR